MRHAAAVAFIMMSLPFAAAMADVYRSVDAQGHVQYSDTPTPGAELVHVQKLGQVPSSTVTATSIANQAKAVAASNDQTHDTLVKQAAQQAVQQDEAQTRADQCKKASANYDQAIQARRIYKTGADGERQYLTDEEAENQRVALKLAMDNACGS